MLNLKVVHDCDKLTLRKRVGHPTLSFVYKGDNKHKMDELKRNIESVLSQMHCHLYELEWLTDQKPPILRISIEKEDGTVDLDTCAACSDAISTMLDETDFFDKEYMLEVCSPGAERELKTDEQIQRALNSYVLVKLKDPKQGLDQVIGDLIEVNEDTVKIQYRDKTRTKTIEIERSNISLIRTAVKF